MHKGLFIGAVFFSILGIFLAIGGVLAVVHFAEHEAAEAAAQERDIEMRMDSMTNLVLVHNDDGTWDLYGKIYNCPMVKRNIGRDFAIDSRSYTSGPNDPFAR